MTGEVKILRALHGSAQADGSAGTGRISFRLSAMPERRWLELFDACKGEAFTTEERSNEFLLHVQCSPGEVAKKRDTAALLIDDVNGRWQAENSRQRALARERDDKKRALEAALNQELEALNFDQS